MIQKTAFSCLLILLMGVSIHAALVSGEDIILCDSNLTFSPHAVTPNTLARDAYAGRLYPCIQITPSIDLFFAIEFNLYVCSYICRNTAVGSPRPFYVSKQQYADSLVRLPLNVGDTTRFTRIDTVRIDNHGPTGPRTGCFLPHLGTTSASANPVNSGYFLILDNADGKHILAKMTAIISQGMDGTYVYYYLSGYRIQWYLQTDGSFNFTGLAGVRQPSFKPVSCRNGLKSHAISAQKFNISGQLISGKDNSLRNAHGIYLIRTADGIKPVLWRNSIRNVP